MRTRIGALVAALVLGGAVGAHAHGGNPNMRSVVESITPAVDGVTAEVRNFDDRLVLRNSSGEDVLVEDYEGRSYVRLHADGTVEVNTSSEAHYLNDDRYARAGVPQDLGREPSWERVDARGAFEWHDHRIHWMSRSTPPQVTDEGRRTPIFDWEVPVVVGGERGAITGSLTWVPSPSGGGPPAVFWVGAGLLVALSFAGMVLRLRRRGPGGGEAPEAW